MSEHTVNERIAQAMGVGPRHFWTIEDDPRRFSILDAAWRALGCLPQAEAERIGAPREHVEWPRYDSDDSPRSLLAGVEAEIERRGLKDQYTAEIIDQVGYDTDIFRIATAPAAIRAASAAAVLDAEGER